MEHSVGQQDKLTPRRLDVMIRGLEGLPTFPGVVARLISLIIGIGQRDGEAAEPELGLLISSDLSLTARLLSLANREYGRVDTVTQAIERAPASAIRPVMLSTKVFQLPAAGGLSDGGMDAPAFWRHCLAVACAAEDLARKTELADAEVAYTCGLLHDIGKLVLWQCLPKSYARTVEMARSHNGNIAEYERKLIGMDHAVVGRRVSTHWRLPEAAENTIWLAHQPLEAIPPSLSHRQLVGVVSLADTIAREQELGFSGNFTFHRSSRQLADQLEISPSVVSAVIESLPDRLQKRYSLLALDGRDCEMLYRQALSKANVELGRLNNEACGRLERMSAQAKAFEHLRSFTAALSGDATLCEILLGVADVMAAAQGHSPTSAQPVIAYSTGQAEGGIFAVRCDGSSEPKWATFNCRSWVGGDRGPAESGDGSGVPVDFPAGIDGLADWADVSACIHQPLVCGGRWIGGVLVPGSGQDGNGTGPMVEHVTGALALALAMVQGRLRAMELSEQLAGASQVLAATQEALAEARILAAVGEMAAGAAHELNNPLAVVSGRAQLMREKAGSQEEQDAWELIADQARRISDIVTELMDFASPPPPNPAAVELPVLLEEAREAFSSSDHPQAGSARVDIEIGADTPAVMADRAQVRAVMVELIMNAATAKQAASAVRVTAELDEVYDAVVLAVQDNGPGMDDKTLQRVFTPFFSSQQAGRRRGLGLPRAKRYVENNGGRIWIKSKPGHGTTVYVQLPRA